MHMPVSDTFYPIVAYFQQRRRTRIRIPNPIVTLYYAQLFPLVRIRIRIRVWRLFQMVTVPILGMDLRPQGFRNPNPSPLLSPCVVIIPKISCKKVALSQ